MRYDTADYAEGRLAGTIIKLDGKAVKLSHCFGDMMALVVDISTGQDKEVKLDDLDLSPIQLGYVNRGGEAYYLKRLPKREDWRQGLRCNNVSHHQMLGMGVVQLLSGDYPTFEEAHERVTAYEQNSVAFSRVFAVEMYGYLRYKGRDCVGKVGKDAKITLHPTFLYLTEALKEALNEH